MAGGTQNLAKTFLPRLFRKLFPGQQPRDLRILDVGCGLGQAVSTLRENGYDAWGVAFGGSLDDIDAPARPFVLAFDTFAISETVLELGKFDFVMSNGVIEHVGTRDAQDRLADDFVERRKAFLARSLSMLKPGGVLLVGGPNRLFPFDFQHATHVYGRLAGVKKSFPMLGSLTIPWHRANFLLSYGDISRLIDQPSLQRMTCTQLDYCGLASLGRRCALKGVFRAYIRAVSLLPHAVRVYLEPHALFLCRVAIPD